MNKWQIICPLVTLTLVAVVFARISGANHCRAYVYAHSRMIGQELVATTNSPHLVHIGPGLTQRLSEFLAFPTGVAGVELGDEPAPIGNGRACSRVIITNAS